jgi:tetratricopeptide (TPR) repeat protein/transcriptional regulator with XRE-family HTH domain
MAGDVEQISSKVVAEAAQARTVADVARLLRQLRRRYARLRRDTELTYRELAAKTGWSHAAIGEYFTGKTLPTTNRFDELVRLLNATPTEQGALATARDRVAERQRAKPADRTASAKPLLPRQLPPDVHAFTGRTDYLDHLDEFVFGRLEATTAAVVGIAGPPGVGKTALALHWAHRVRACFPDGQLYLNFQGYAEEAQLQPLEALTKCLASLDIPPEQVPTDIAEATGMLRSLLADRRVLLVLDNVRDAAQVRPLLPAGPGCAAVVTTRETSAIVDTELQLRLDMLTPEEAADLLATFAGQRRVRADPAAVDTVSLLCGHLPLALRIAGARLRARPAWPVDTLARRLAGTQHRLDELQCADLGVRASFTVTADALAGSRDPVDRAAASAFGLLSLFDGADIGTAAAAGLLDVPEPVAGRSLERLVDAHLLESPKPGRYQFHDLIRLFAREVADRRFPPVDRAGAISRLLAWYTATAWQAFRVYRPGDPRPALLADQWVEGGQEFATMRETLDWLAIEFDNLIAAVDQAADTATVPARLHLSLTAAVSAALWMKGYRQEFMRVNRRALPVARRLGDHSAAGHCLLHLGVAAEMCDDYEEALARLRDCLEAFDEAADGYGRAHGLHAIGNMAVYQGRHHDALRCYSEALTIRQAQDDIHGQAVSLSHVGLIHQILGDVERAAALHRRALTVFDELGERRGQAYALHSLALCHRAAGRYGSALACLRRSLPTLRMLGDLNGTAEVMKDLGVVLRDRGEAESAADCLRQSVHEARRVANRRMEAIGLHELGTTLAVLGRPEQARDHWQAALSTFEELGMAEADQVRALLADSGR